MDYNLGTVPGDLLVSHRDASIVNCKIMLKCPPTFHGSFSVAERKPILIGVVEVMERSNGFAYPTLDRFSYVEDV